MSLLTEKQIKEILLIIENEVNVKWSDTMLLEMLFEWNKKQTTQQFEPDWSKAPEGVKSAILKSYWVAEDTYVFDQTVAKYKRPAPVITSHPHAEIMAKYAEVAARRVDPWVEFEFKHKFNENWESFICHPHFAVDYKYRHIGDNK